ncbi:MAG: DUF3795 domain-containing protein [Spirochaetota bacterium]|nr:DUF3795 domain-containing protein [Spirochaetota bacterium]
MVERDDLIAFCGLYCDDCFGYKGKIADLARDLRKELRQEKFDRIVDGIPFKEFRNYKECYDVLGALVRLRCKNACRGGGGNPFCKIRKCCQKMEIVGCWECNEFEKCEKLDFLKVNHGDAHLKNLRIINKKGVDEFFYGKKYWYTVIKEKK